VGKTKGLLTALIIVFVTLVALSSCFIAFVVKSPKEIIISKVYNSGNQTFQSLEPSCEIELKKGETFQWDNWMIEVK
jgi:hypothetical protein